MKLCSIQIAMMAIHVDQRHGENSSTSGITSSHVVPPICASRWVTRDGRMSLG